MESGLKLSSSVEFVGVTVQWVSGLLLLLLFLQFPRLGASRRLVGIWAAAWAAHVLAITGVALETMVVLRGWSLQQSIWRDTLMAIRYPGELVFISLVTIGALRAAGKPTPFSASRRIAVIAALTGAILIAVGFPEIAMQLQLVCMPVLFVYCAGLIFARAYPPRRWGLLVFAQALVLSAIPSTLYVVHQFIEPSPSAFYRLVKGVSDHSGLIDSLTLACLGGAIVLLIVQDSLLEAAQARDQRVRDLAASESRLERIIAAAREAIITVDEHGRIDLANGAAEALFRLAPGTAVGLPLEKLVEVSPTPLMEALERAMTARGDPAGESTATLSASGRRSDGSRFPLEFTVGALAVGGLRASVVIIRDLTSRHAADADREQFEKRMAESEKMLAIGRVVSGIAHELNNPLAVVLGQSEQLIDSSESDDVKGGLQLIKEQALRARHIVKDVLAFVRQRDERSAPVDLAHLAKRLSVAQASEAASHRVTLLTEIPERLPPVLADRVGIEQAVVNLLDNAMDAAGPGGVVTLTARAKNGRAEIVVEDNGPGISDDLVPRIFEPFFTTKPIGEGTGLGLAVSIGLVKQDAGTITLENRPVLGVGARFIVSIPIDPDAMAEPPLPVARTATLPAPVRRGDGEFADVLVIDDEAAVRSTLARIFQRSGWPVREASSGEEALAYLLEVPWDVAPAVILCDLKMPGIGGAAVHAQLALTRPEMLARLIFCTGDTVAQSTAVFLASAGREVVEKPFTAAEIAGAVERVVGTL